ncbi:MAG: hypothetical protein H7Z41_02265 [Cytophagales bacterium]|nr:hypothetical protein [Armatimonadota bacterium]
MLDCWCRSTWGAPDQPGGIGLFVDPAINYGQNRFAVGSALTGFPSETDPLSEPGFFGPNFQFRTTAAPDASSLPLMAMGGMGLLGIALKRRRYAA